MIHTAFKYHQDLRVKLVFIYKKIVQVQLPLKNSLAVNTVHVSHFICKHNCVNLHQKTPPWFYAVTFHLFITSKSLDEA